MFAGFIPVSLFVTIEGVELLQNLHIRRDMEMRNAEGKKGCETKTAQLVSELGRVRYIMSDKTGTLTQNEMLFRRCSVGGVKYANKKSRRTQEFYAKKMLQHLTNNSMGNAAQLREFFTSCAICHTVNTEMVGEKIAYNATSPDELAIVTFASKAGYKFHSRSKAKIIVNTKVGYIEFELLAILEFNSERKRMSVIVRDKQGHITIYSKGADTTILPRLANPPAKLLRRSRSHLSSFASEGYRTLCFAYRRLTKVEFQTWKAQYDEAMLATGKNKKELISACADKIETDFELIGISAIEDRLQEGAIETIEKLLAAGIHVWVLTGDKLETAMNIGTSCKLLNPKTPTLMLDTKDPETTAAKIEGYVSILGVENLAKKYLKLTLIVDATSLSFMLESEELRLQFMRVALACATVICCRCTPSQKAAVTDLVKQSVAGSVLAIGDGGNDVAMIQKASVGVGIAGKEGMQAAISSDFAVYKFKHLERLLFVHGSLSLFRSTKCILFVLYKGVLESLLHAYFIFLNGHTAQLFADIINAMRYSMWFCAWPCLNLGVFDRPAPVDFMATKTKLYFFYNNSVTLMRLVQWATCAVFHAMCINIFNHLNNFWGVALDSKGQPCPMYVVGNTIYALAACIVNLKMLLETDSMTYWVIVSVVSGLVMLPISIFFDSFSTQFINFTEPQNDYLFLQIPYLNSILLAGLVLGFIFLMEITFKAIRRTIYESDAEQALYRSGIRIINYNILYKPLYKFCDIVGIKTENEMFRNGFAFAQDEGDFVTQQQIIEATVASKRDDKNRRDRSDKTIEASSEQTQLDGSNGGNSKQQIACEQE